MKNKKKQQPERVSINRIDSFANGVWQKEAQQQLIDKMAAMLTKQYYADLKVVEDTFDRNVQANLEAFRSHDWRTMTCVVQLEEGSHSLMSRYCSEMQALSDICGTLGLSASRIARSFRVPE